MAARGVTITLIAGGITFTNQWYQVKTVDWKVPVATVLLAAGVGAVESVDEKAGLILSLLVLLGAATTQFGGKSVADTISGLVNARPASAVKTTATPAKGTKTTT